MTAIKMITMPAAMIAPRLDVATGSCMSALKRATMAILLIRMDVEAIVHYPPVVTASFRPEKNATIATMLKPIYVGRTAC